MAEKRQQNERITAVVMVGFSLVFFLKGLTLQFGTFKSPGPGFIPFIVGILLLTCGSAYFFRVFRKRDIQVAGGSPAEREERNYGAVFGITFCAFLFPLLLGPLNFLITTFAVSSLMLLCLRPKKWGRALILAAGLAIASFLIFARLLGVSLPMGLLEILLFRIGG